MTQRYVVVDLETTGNSVKKGDKIIQFAAVVVEDGRIAEQFSTFLNPEQPLTPFIEELTGISSEQLEGAPLFADIAPEINRLLDKACFVAHNVLFDLSFLQDELLAAGFSGFYGPTIDTVELAKIMRPQSASYKLSHLAAAEGLIHERPHQADSDALVTAELLMKFADELKQIPLVTLKQLLALSHSLQSEVSELMEFTLQERMKQSPLHHPYLQIHKGIAFRKPTSPEKLQRPLAAVFPKANEEKKEMLRKAFSQFEAREGQLNMMDDVYRLISGGKLAMLEAGTGLGKTLGYLMPAAYVSVAKNEKVIISTYTIELQNQLLHKELINLRNSLPFPVQTAILKGRSNYISLANVDRVLRIRDDNYDSALTKMQILIWLLQTETGDRDELNLTSGGELFWEKLHNGIRLSNEHQASWEPFDFYNRAKAQAEVADLIITNHAYLLSDYFTNKDGMFSGSTIIIDEAHQLDHAASKHLGTSFDYISIKMMLNKIGNAEQKLLLYRLKNLLMEGTGMDGGVCTRIENLVQETGYELEQFFRMLAGMAEKRMAGVSDRNAANLRDILLSSPNQRALLMLVERLVDHFKQLAGLLDESTAHILKSSQLGKSQMFYLSELYTLVQFMKEKCGQMKEYFLKPNDGTIYWLEWNRNSPSQYVYLYSQPILAGNTLWNRFFSKQKSVILTSSTLTVNGSFAYMKKKLGIDGQECETLEYPSPFDYKGKVRMLVASDIPEVNRVKVEEYAAWIAAYIRDAALASKGRMLVLFTSHEMLKETHEWLKNESELDDFSILSHGVSSNSKSRLIKYFQNYDKSILLGTAGFWDGLDLPGETLQCLMMVRLPFSSPSEPVTEAKCNEIIADGGNPFSAYSLPEAVIRFRQGFGRLIRTNEDRGVFIVCDRRIVTSPYGRDFLQSIPNIDKAEISLDALKPAIKEWL